MQGPHLVHPGVEGTVADWFAPPHMKPWGEAPPWLTLALVLCLISLCFRTMIFNLFHLVAQIN